MKVLFVCSGNAYRSPVAEALLKKYAPWVEADSAGTLPVTLVAESARRFLLRENAADGLKQRSEGIWEKPLADYDLIVVMEVGHKYAVMSRCPECAERIEVWDIEDPYFTSAGFEEKVFLEIKKRVLELVERLKGADS
ncbi:MAG: low molecular weight phosphatase family protein [Candidatus Bathyarchaeia archaeon]